MTINATITIQVQPANTYRHGLMTALENQLAAGNFDQSAVSARADRAVRVIESYDFVDLGIYTNGWNERVHGYELTSPEGRRYEVQLRADGQGSCNCPDWKFRRASNAGLCKHVLAARAVAGIL